MSAASRGRNPRAPGPQQFRGLRQFIRIACGDDHPPVSIQQGPGHQQSESAGSPNDKAIGEALINPGWRATSTNAPGVPPNTAGDERHTVKACEHSPGKASKTSASRRSPIPRSREPTDAIIRVTSTAICGSDLHLYKVLAPI